MTAFTSLSPLGQAALQYVRRGWPVFPCRERDGEPYVDRKTGETRRAKAKAPYTGTGLKDATRDEARVIAWWRRNPEAMIGLPAGDNRCFVLDFDPREVEVFDEATGEVTVDGDGRPVMRRLGLDELKAALEAQMGVALPRSVTAMTPSGGVHVFFRQPEGEPIRNRGNLPDHVDVRGRGGYTIAPPSRCLEAAESATGEYRWLDRGDWRDDAMFAEAPAELIAILRAPKARATNDVAGDQPAAASTLPRTPRPAVDSAEAAVRRYALAALDAEASTLAATPKGGRNIQINASAFALGQLVGAGVLGEAVVRATLRAITDAMPANEDPAGAHRTIENGLTAGIAQPRDLSAIAEAARRRADRPPSRRAAPVPRQGDEVSNPSGVEGNGPDDPGRSAGEDEAVHRRCIFKPHTDLGNAERFVERFGDAFRWSPALGWLGWDGRRWVPLKQEEKAVPPEVLDAVFKTVRAIQDEAKLIEARGGVRPAWLDAWENGEGDERKLTVLERAELGLYRASDEGARREADEAALALAAGADPDEQLFNRIVEVKRGRALTFAQYHREYGRKSEANGKLSCIAKLAQPWLAVRDDAFDADPLTVNVLNGTLRFRRVRVGDVWRGEWRLDPHRREDLISKLAPVTFDRDAACPLYDRTLGWAQERAAMRRYLHQWGGLSMTGHMGEQKLHFWYGLGGNGKSTVIDAWCHVLGDYTTTVPIETFLDQGVKRRGDQATPELARLGGVRLLRTSEPERGAKLAAALIKLVTGGEPMSVRFLNRGFFDLRPIFKMTISGNFRPEIGDTDEGIWRRVKLIPWPRNIDKPPPGATDWPEKDTELGEKLKAEGSGILNRLVDGVLDWLENGLIEPREVTAATAEYRTESDPLARFLKLCTRADPDARAQSSKLHELFSAWCKAAGEREWTQKGFSKAMLDKGFEKKASDGMQWLGIEMIRSPGDFIDEHGKPIAFSLGDDAPAGGSARDGPPAPDGWADDDDVPL